jgi:hypothetical protein
MKKIIILTLITTIVFTGCSSNSSTTADQSQEAAVIAEKENITNLESENVDKTEEKSSASENSTEADLETETVVDTEVEEKSTTVEITLPALYAEGTTQEELDQTCADYNFMSATLNEDGSVTYIMTKAAHELFMNVLEEELKNELLTMIGSTDYPSITAIETNNDYSEFNVTTNSTELSSNDSISAFIFYTAGGMYNLCNGNESANITVNFINADTGDVIYTGNSSEMELE